MSDTAQNTQQWLDSWKRAAASLQALKKKTLRAPDYYEKNREQLDAMLQYACEHAAPRAHSGLVSLQRHLMKLKDRETRKP